MVLGEKRSENVLPEEEDIDDAALDQRIMEEIKKEELDVDPNNIIIGKRRRRNQEEDFVDLDEVELGGAQMPEGIENFVAETKYMSTKQL